MNPRQHSTGGHRTPDSSLLFFIGILLASLNLRPALTAVGPLMGNIRQDYHLSHWSAGLITSLPLLVFFLISPFVPRLSHRLTNGGTMIIGLFFLFSGIGLRSFFPAPFWLYLGTLFVGLGIGICNVLLPGLVKDRFPHQVGPVTSAYSTVMGIFASLASGISVPLASRWGLGWRGSLGLWAVPALVAFLLWLFLERKNRNIEKRIESNWPKGNRMWKSALAWQVALFFGFQSLLFYVTVTWLPEMLVAKGYSLSAAGWLLSLLQIIGLPASFIVPLLAGRVRSQSRIGGALGIFMAAGFAGLFVTNHHGMIFLSLLAIGVPLNGSFSLGLTLLALRSKDGHDANLLSGMVQSFGYLVSAVGPILFGSLYDVTGNWNLPYWLLIGTSLLVSFFGWRAGRDQYV